MLHRGLGWAYGSLSNPRGAPLRWGQPPTKGSEGSSDPWWLPLGVQRAGSNHLCCPSPSQSGKSVATASIQALTITPARSQAIVVLGAIISCGHPLALQRPQGMDVQT